MQESLYCLFQKKIQDGNDKRVAHFFLREFARFTGSICWTCESRSAEERPFGDTILCGDLGEPPLLECEDPIRLEPEPLLPVGI